MISSKECQEKSKQKPYIVNIEGNQVFSADYVFQMMNSLQRQIDRTKGGLLFLAGIYLISLATVLTAIALVR